jgi:iron complex outermembrane recepter protein
MKRILISTTALSIGMGLGSTAHAQNTAEEAGGIIALEEIVVTAQRREENVQRSSLAIEVLSGEDMQGITQPTDLNTAAPGVQIAMAGNIAQTFIRGVGAFVANGRAEGAVAYSLDGAYLSTGTAVLPAMYDLARVEILKGPQGTLYGRNATGGAVNLISNRPRLGEFSGYVGGDVGNFDLRRINGAVNLPAGDTLAIRTAFQITERDGYLSDGTMDDDTKAGRIRALWEPSGDFSVLFNVEAAKIDTLGSGSGVIPVIGGDPWLGPLDPRVAGLLGTSSRERPYFDNDQWSVSTEVNWNVGIGTLTVIPAYRHEEYDSLIYSPGFSFAETQEAKQKTFEARLGDQTDLAKWVVGAYYYDMDQSFTFDIANDLQFPPQDTLVTYPGQSTTSWAVFGETTISVADPFRIIAGLRYTQDEQEALAYSNGRSSPLSPSTSPAFDPFGQWPNDFYNDISTDSDAISWKGGFEFDVSDDSMAFFTVSRGFKGDGFFQDATGQSGLPVPNTGPQFVTYDPEELTAFELGLRNRLFDNSLQLNVELFYWDYKDHQVAYVGFNSIGAPGFITSNAGAAEIYGADVDLTWRLTGADTLHVGAEYLHARYEDFKRVTVAPGDVGSLCATNPLPPAPTGIPQVEMDCSGQVMQRSPELTGSVNYSHRFDLPNGGALTFGADAIYSDEKYLSINLTPATLVDETVIGNADLTYSARNDRWSVAAWVKNVSDENYYSGGGVSPRFPSIVFATINPPRTYGARFNVNF